MLHSTTITFLQSSISPCRRSEGSAAIREGRDRATAKWSMPLYSYTSTPTPTRHAVELYQPYQPVRTYRNLLEPYMCSQSHVISLSGPTVPVYSQSAHCATTYHYKVQTAQDGTGNQSGTAVELYQSYQPCRIDGRNSEHLQVLVQLQNRSQVNMHVIPCRIARQREFFAVLCSVSPYLWPVIGERNREETGHGQMPSALWAVDCGNNSGKAGATPAETIGTCAATVGGGFISDLFIRYSYALPPSHTDTLFENILSPTVAAPHDQTTKFTDSQIHGFQTYAAAS